MSFAVLDWRRRVHALYAQVRATPDARAAHDLWRVGRDELFAQHPASPLLAEDRASFTGLPYAPYEPAWACPLAPPATCSTPTSAPGS